MYVYIYICIYIYICVHLGSSCRLQSSAPAPTLQGAIGDKLDLQRKLTGMWKVVMRGSHASQIALLNSLM